MDWSLLEENSRRELPNSEGVSPPRRESERELPKTLAPEGLACSWYDVALYFLFCARGEGAAATGGLGKRDATGVDSEGGREGGARAPCR